MNAFTDTFREIAGPRLTIRRCIVRRLAAGDRVPSSRFVARITGLPKTAAHTFLMRELQDFVLARGGVGKGRRLFVVAVPR